MRAAVGIVVCCRRRMYVEVGEGGCVGVNFGCGSEGRGGFGCEGYGEILRWGESWSYGVEVVVMVAVMFIVGVRCKVGVGFGFGVGISVMSRMRSRMRFMLRVWVRYSV